MSGLAKLECPFYFYVLASQSQKDEEGVNRNWNLRQDIATAFHPSPY